MSVPTKQITEKRLKRWAARLAEQDSTPLVLVGIGHNSKIGQLTVLTCEDVDDSTLAAALAYAHNQLTR